MRSLIVLVSVVMVLCCLSMPSTRAETKAGDKPTDRADKAQRLATAEVQRFEYFMADGETQLKIHPMPVHRYTRQHNGEVYTNLFIWTRQGRPEVIASISSWFSPRPYHGLAVTSLSTEKLIGMRDGKEIWHPRNAGVVFKPVPGVRNPDETGVRRLRQMKLLAREFTAEFNREPDYHESGKLRLLSTPLYRYQSQNSGVIDGALFGFAYGTAPQLILLIEARETRAGSRWEYALAPRNSTEYRVRYKGQEVWKLAQLAPPWPNSKNPTKPYSVFHDLQKDGRTQELVDRLLKFERISE